MDVGFEQGESDGVGFVYGGEELLLEILSTHTAGYVVIIWVRGSPFGWMPVYLNLLRSQYYMNPWYAQTCRAIAGFAALEVLFPDEEFLMFPDSSDAIGLKRYDVDTSDAYEDLKDKVKKLNNAGKKCLIMMIDINRLNGTARVAKEMAEGLKKLGAEVVSMRQFQYNEGGEGQILPMQQWVEVQRGGLAKYMQHWEEMQAAADEKAEAGTKIMQQRL